MTPQDFSTALSALIASARGDGMSLDEVQTELEAAIEGLEEEAEDNA